MWFLFYSTLFCICILQVYSGLFNFNTDNFFKLYLKGIFTARPRLSSKTVTPIDIKAYVRRTTERLPKTTLKDKYSRLTETDDDFNLTRNELERRKLRTDLDMILSKNSTAINFDVDEIAVLTRRFDDLREKPAVGPQEYLREIYFYQIEKKKHYYQKNKTLQLMEQFVYETRYKLPYVQLLQKKYKGTYRYQIGYCFAILQHLKQEQHVLYSTMRKYMRDFQNIYIHLKMYEKIIRLDVDIKDVIAFIKAINWKRMQVENVDYFQQVKHLQQ